MQVVIRMKQCETWIISQEDLISTVFSKLTGSLPQAVADGNRVFLRAGQFCDPPALRDSLERGFSELGPERFSKN